LEPRWRKEKEAVGKCVMKSIRICIFLDCGGIETEKDENALHVASMGGLKCIKDHQ
jgi:hypothetical protein